MTLLAEMRDNAEMSLRGLANKTGISKTKLWRIENGEVSPTIDEVTNIYTALSKLFALYAVGNNTAQERREKLREAIDKLTDAEVSMAISILERMAEKQRTDNSSSEYTVRHARGGKTIYERHIRNCEGNKR